MDEWMYEWKDGCMDGTRGAAHALPALETLIHLPLK